MTVEEKIDDFWTLPPSSRTKERLRELVLDLIKEETIKELQLIADKWADNGIAPPEHISNRIAQLQAELKEVGDE